MSQPPLRASISNVPSDQADILRRWRNGLSDGGKAGLWVYGPRRSGSSYIAEAAVRRVSQEVDTWEQVDALILTSYVRQSWNLSDSVRHHPDDYGLWTECQEMQLQLEFLWHQCQLLWVNDFHRDVVDVAFWRRHVEPWIEIRVKSDMPTIIATDLTPADPEMGGLQQVIEDLFVICHAKR